jgi:hypothetical protein
MSRHQEIARVRADIRKAKRVFLLLDHDYHDRIGGIYIHVSKARASQIVGYVPDNAEPFKLSWEGDDLYIPPAFTPED